VIQCEKIQKNCKACIAAGIPCTTKRASRPRGPPNRLAEMIKKINASDTIVESCKFSSLSPTASSAVLPDLPCLTPSSVLPPLLPARAASSPVALLAKQASNCHDHKDLNFFVDGRESASLCAETIFPLDTLHALLDGFFTYLYPLCPFPHAPSFREAWVRREDIASQSFLALLASMLGAYIATFPQQAKSQMERSSHIIRDNDLTNDIEACRRVCVAARGVDCTGSDGWEVHTAAASYFLALLHIRAERWRQGSVYLGECFTVLGSTRIHSNEQTAYSHRSLPGSCVFQRRAAINTGPTEDNKFLAATGGFIGDEVGRRIFWAAFADTMAHLQLGAPIASHIIPPSTLAQSHPPLPSAVDDVYIHPDRISSQPAEVLSIVTYFNTTVEVYRGYNTALCSASQGSPGVVHQSQDYKRHLWLEALRKSRDCCASLEFDEKHKKRLTMNLNAGCVERSTLQSSARPNSPQPLVAAYTKQQRRMQHELQIARLISSQASVRLYILETLIHLEMLEDRDRHAVRPLAEKGWIIHDLVCEKQVTVQSLLDGLNCLGGNIMDICANNLVSEQIDISSWHI